MNLPLQAPAPASRPRRSVMARTWDVLSLYLPVLLMMGLALTTYFLLQATPQPEEPEAELPVSSDPDYFMRRFSVRVFGPNGVLQNEVYGSEARHHPDTDQTVIDDARIRSYSEQGQLSTATARQIVSNGESTVFELTGEAAVIRQAGRSATGQRLARMEFHGEFLRVSTDPESIESDQPVLLVRDGDQITADALQYRGEERIADLTGQVRATLAPRQP